MEKNNNSIIFSPNENTLNDDLINFAYELEKKPINSQTEYYKNQSKIINEILTQYDKMYIDTSSIKCHKYTE